MSPSGASGCASAPETKMKEAPKAQNNLRHNRFDVGELNIEMMNLKLFIFSLLRYDLICVCQSLITNKMKFGKIKIRVWHIDIQCFHFAHSINGEMHHSAREHHLFGPIQLEGIVVPVL